MDEISVLSEQLVREEGISKELSQKIQICEETLLKTNELMQRKERVERLLERQQTENGKMRVLVQKLEERISLLKESSQNIDIPSLQEQLIKAEKEMGELKAKIDEYEKEADIWEIKNRELSSLQDKIERQKQINDTLQRRLEQSKARLTQGKK